MPAARAAKDGVLSTQDVTDKKRWSDPKQLRPEWEPRTRVAATLVPAGSVVLDLGCGEMALERYLPAGCAYRPCDVVARDQRTMVCDFNKGELPERSDANLVSVLGVVEYLADVPAFLRGLLSYRLPVLLSYCPSDLTAHLDRAALGWLNHLTMDGLEGCFRAAGFSIAQRMRIDGIQCLYRIEPNAGAAVAEKSVLVISYNNVGNFGDRLGFHLINDILPSNACVTHAHFRPWNVPDADYDLIVLGIGNSIFAPLMDDELFRVLSRGKRVVGIFGTQYRPAIDANKMARLIERLDAWYARYEEDALLYARGRNNVFHLGDWLINAFPMARGTRTELLTVGDEIWKDLPLDRVIQKVQSFRRVYSTRLHPLLCALTSASEVAYAEQLDGSGGASGKFHSMMLDVFGRSWPEKQFFAVPRDAVVRYKAKVRQATLAMAARLNEIVNGHAA